MNEPNEENSMPVDNVRGETFKEHDIYMNELLKSLKTTDKDGITEDPFISVGEKYTSVAQFKECLTYYALANGFSLWHERSGEGRVVAKFQSWVHCKVGSDCDPDGKTYFDRFYVCFVGLADRWKAGCRKLIALDGCFLKKPNQGEILTATGRDEEDLCCSRGNGLTLMSDQHKGPINAVEDLFWAASKASYPQLFNKIMDKIKSANPNAHKFWHVIPAGRKLFEVRSGSEGFTIDEGKRTCSCRMWQLSGLPCVHSTKPDQSMYFTVLPPKPRKMLGRPKKKSIRAIGKGGSSTRVSKRGPVRDEGASGTRGDAIGSRGRGGRGGAVGSRGGASGSIGRGAGRSGDANGSRGRGTAGSRGGASGSRGRGAGRSKRKHVSTVGTQKKTR
ncbi:multidrug resistance-associated protein 5 [Tanacetum coccineum]